MATELKILDDEIRLLRDNYKSQLVNIDAELNPLLERVETFKKRRSLIQNRLIELEKALDSDNGSETKQLKMPIHVSSLVALDYDSSFKFPKKIDFVFENYAEKLFSTRELYNRLCDLEPELKESEKRTIESISITLSNGVKSGKYYVGNTVDIKGKKRFGMT